MSDKPIGRSVKSNDQMSSLLRPSHAGIYLRRLRDVSSHSRPPRPPFQEKEIACTAILEGPVAQPMLERKQAIRLRYNQKNIKVEGLPSGALVLFWADIYLRDKTSPRYERVEIYKKSNSHLVVTIEFESKAKAEKIGLLAIARQRESFTAEPIGASASRNKPKLLSSPSRLTFDGIARSPMDSLDKVSNGETAGSKDDIKSPEASHASPDRPTLDFTSAKTPEKPEKSSTETETLPETPKSLKNQSRKPSSAKKSKRPRLLVDYSAELLTDDEGAAGEIDPANEPTEEAMKILEARDLVYAEYQSPSETRKVRLFRSDIGRLLPNYFLNDTLVNFFTKYYLDQLQMSNPEAASKVYIFSTYFYSQCSDISGLDRMLPFLKKIPLDKSVYLIPIHGANHWTLAALVGINQIECNQSAKLVLLDSLGPSQVVSRGIKRVIIGVFRKLFELNKPDIKFNPRIPCIIGDAPVQTNSVDCGVYMLNYIVDILHDLTGFIDLAEKSVRALALEWSPLSSVTNYGDREQLLSIVEKFKALELTPDPASAHEEDDSIEVEEVRVSKVK